MPEVFERLDLTDLTRVRFSPMGQLDAEEIAGWRYPGVYAFYDFRADPEDERDLLDTRYRDGTYFSAHLPGSRLIGFAELKPIHGAGLEIGLGLRPECTGRGLGREYVKQLCVWAERRARPDRLVLRVASFNTRAIRVYAELGFTRTGVEITASYGTEVEFVRMERDLAQP